LHRSLRHWSPLPQPIPASRLQLPLPSQAPSVHSSAGSLPATTKAQVPSATPVSSLAQDWHSASQAPAQHTRSTQKLVGHCPGLTQALPVSLTHTPLPSHTSPPPSKQTVPGSAKVTPQLPPSQVL